MCRLARRSVGPYTAFFKARWRVNHRGAERPNSHPSTLVSMELPMKRFIVLVAVISCAGCTTLQPIVGTSTELQQRISSGELLKAGDRVSIVTADAKTHTLAVREITAGVIVGKADTIPVEQVVSLEKRQF